jgi:hypothetical protein
VGLVVRGCGILSLAASLGRLQSWSSVEHETVPEYLARNGWPQLRYLLLTWYGLFFLILAFGLVVIVRLSRRKDESRSKLDGEIQDFLIMPLTQPDWSARINFWLRAYIINAGEPRTGIKHFRLSCEINGTKYDAPYAEDEKLVQTHEAGIVKGFKGKEFYNLLDFIRDHKTLANGEHVTGHLHFVLPAPPTRDISGLSKFSLEITDTWGATHPIEPKRVPVHPSDRIMRPTEYAFKPTEVEFDEVKRERDLLKSQLDHKVILEVIEEPWQGVALAQRYNSVVLIQGTPDSDAPSFSWLMPEVRIEFDNRDVHRTRIESCVLAIRREIAGSEPEEIVLMSRLETEHGNVVNVESIFLDGREKSRIYFLKADHHLFEDWNDKFDSNTFLRIKMQSVGQREYCVDLNVDWEQAKKNEAPWAPGSITIRKVNSC